MNPPPQCSGIHSGDDAPQTVGAAEWTTQPRLPELRRSSQGQSVQTPESGPVDGENGFHHQGRGDPWKKAMIRYPVDDPGGELEDLFRIPEQASENSFTPFFVLSVSTPVQKFLPRTFARSGNQLRPGERVLPSVSAQRSDAVCLPDCARGKERNAVLRWHTDNWAFRIFGCAATSCHEAADG